MDIYLGSWFNEPGIHFDFSHKVNIYIKEMIIKHIAVPLELDKLHVGKDLHLTVTTKTSQNELKIKIGHKWSNRTTSRNIGLWFPYEKIVKSKYPLEKYVSCFVQSLGIIFKEWGISEKQISNFRESCDYILHNPAMN